MGKRACLPSQKALKAQMTAKQGQYQRGSKVRMKKLEMEFNGIVTGPSSPDQISQSKASNRWEQLFQATTSSRTRNQTSSGHKFWADQVEEENVNPFVKSSIWDRFDITKITNVEFKVGYVESKMHCESPLIDIEIEESKMHCESPLIEIEIEDISSEIAYWRFVVVCHVLGAHPLFEVLKGFIQRIWSKLGINKIAMLKNGIIIVHFYAEARKQEEL
ncbi:hypothetical protein FXO37_03756 [Capsicum annuum]|nr:hypothetical protein FXO37_03756 [Capsicum annuum]